MTEARNGPGIDFKFCLYRARTREAKKISESKAAPVQNRPGVSSAMTAFNLYRGGRATAKVSFNERTEKVYRTIDVMCVVCMVYKRDGI